MYEKLNEEIKELNKTMRVVRSSLSDKIKELINDSDVLASVGNYVEANKMSKLAGELVEVLKLTYGGKNV